MPESVLLRYFVWEDLIKAAPLRWIRENRKKKIEFLIGEKLTGFRGGLTSQYMLTMGRSSRKAAKTQREEGIIEGDGLVLSLSGRGILIK